MCCRFNQDDFFFLCRNHTFAYPCGDYWSVKCSASVFRSAQSRQAGDGEVMKQETWTDLMNKPCSAHLPPAERWRSHDRSALDKPRMAEPANNHRHARRGLQHALQLRREDVCVQRASALQPCASLHASPSRHSNGGGYGDYTLPTLATLPWRQICHGRGPGLATCTPDLHAAHHVPHVP
jgi:hypothetical protein